MRETRWDGGERVASRAAVRSSFSCKPTSSHYNVGIQTKYKTSYLSGRMTSPEEGQGYWGIFADSTVESAHCKSIELIIAMDRFDHESAITDKGHHQRNL
jgi:hypothetical protein